MSSSKYILVWTIARSFSRSFDRNRDVICKSLPPHEGRLYAIVTIPAGHKNG